ncbi:hypothetical protein HHK36_001980 [Tetracentron sinense]|uniref:F-box domain-containing protein n=1 Tax=Tetracentron sinense TaxID=13715 RepID=A0A834ZX56_TETSI|nr:hypothetical protein HHK36_001980 [Tetracentron sinense]
MGKNCSSTVKQGSTNDEGLGFVHYTRALGRKRVVISNSMDALPQSSIYRTPSKKRYGARSNTNSERSRLESLHQDILVRILCNVDHEDLKQLFHVSKSIRDATLIAKQWHFAFSTPSSKTAVFRVFKDLEDSSNSVYPEAPNAPKQSRISRSRINGKKLADITVALFASPKDERWSRDGLLTET